MGEVDRRGFLRLRRKGSEGEPAEAAEAAAPAEPTERDRQIAELSGFASRLLADVEADGDEVLGEGPVLTKAYDLSYLRITPNYIVYTVVTGFSGLVKTGDVTALEMDKPMESKGHGNLAIGVLRFHHPAEMAGVTRSFAWRFAEDSPLPAAIRTACNLPEPEPEPEPEETEEASAEGQDYYDPEEEGVQWK